MQLFRFGPDVARPITDYGSTFRLSCLLLSREGEVRVDCMHFEPSDSVGHHPAVLPQLFCVVQGKGWVQGEGTERLPISAGQAAFWASGEGHAAGTDNGMTVVAVQAEALDPASVLERSDD